MKVCRNECTVEKYLLRSAAQSRCVSVRVCVGVRREKKLAKVRSPDQGPPAAPMLDAKLGGSDSEQAP